MSEWTQKEFWGWRSTRSPTSAATPGWSPARTPASHFAAKVGAARDQGNANVFLILETHKWLCRTARDVFRHQFEVAPGTERLNGSDA